MIGSLGLDDGVMSEKAKKLLYFLAEHLAIPKEQVDLVIDIGQSLE